MMMSTQDEPPTHTGKRTGAREAAGAPSQRPRYGHNHHDLPRVYIKLERQWVADMDLRWAALDLLRVSLIAATPPPPPAFPISCARISLSLPLPSPALFKTSSLRLAFTARG